MSIIDMFIKGKIQPEGIVTFIDRTGKVLIRCVVPNKPKEAIRRLDSLFDAMAEDTVYNMRWKVKNLWNARHDSKSRADIKDAISKIREITHADLQAS